MQNTWLSETSTSKKIQTVYATGADGRQWKCTISFVGPLAEHGLCSTRIRISESAVQNATMQLNA